MASFVSGLRMLVRLCGAILIILGVCFWTGHLRNWIVAHMLIGLLLMVLLLLLALVGAIRRANPGFVLLVVILAVGMALFGMAQVRLMPGSAHWVVQVVHLLIGIAAIGAGEQLAQRIPTGAPAVRT